MVLGLSLRVPQWGASSYSIIENGATSHISRFLYVNQEWEWETPGRLPLQRLFVYPLTSFGRDPPCPLRGLERLTLPGRVSFLFLHTCERTETRSPSPYRRDGRDDSARPVVSRTFPERLDWIIGVKCLCLCPGPLTTIGSSLNTSWWGPVVRGLGTRCQTTFFSRNRLSSVREGSPPSLPPTRCSEETSRVPGHTFVLLN